VKVVDEEKTFQKSSVPMVTSLNKPKNAKEQTPSRLPIPSHNAKIERYKRLLQPKTKSPRQKVTLATWQLKSSPQAVKS